MANDNHPRPIIALDGRPFSGHVTGIGRYVLALSEALDALLPDAAFVLYSNRPLSVELPSARWTVVAGPRPLRRLPGFLWLKLVMPVLIRRRGCDIFWATRTLLPRLPRGVLSVVTVYDLNHLLVPETMGFATRAAHRFWFAKDLRRADRVIVISRGTRDRLTDLLGIEADGVVSPSVSRRYRPLSPPDILATLARIGVHGPYFLAVGTREPRKNFGVAIEAFQRVRHRYPDSGIQLVIAGASGWGNEATDGLAKRQPGVRLLEYVADESLPALYAGSIALVFPSIYEGFGLPVAEARACGAAVIATDLPEIREAGDEHCEFVCPTADAFEAAMARALTERGHRASPPHPAKPVAGASAGARAFWHAVRG